MPKITALIHSRDDAQRLGRLLDSLHACDEVLIIDHAADKETQSVARKHGATVKAAVPGVSPGAYLVDAANDWILCVQANESVSEALEASLFEWKQGEHEPNRTFAVTLREQKNGMWETRQAVTRLVNRNSVNWTGELPHDDPSSDALAGDLLRFDNP